MAFGIGNLNQIVSDFKNSLNQIFGRGSSVSTKTDLDEFLYKANYGGSIHPDHSKWRGNNDGTKSTVRYGFSVFSLSQIKSPAINGTTDIDTYYLDIPPQSISQKEIFATNIQATRRGVIVESEGVIFKDILIQGTTGVFPGKRGNFNGPQANFQDFTAAPAEDTGVSKDTGLSKDSSIPTISGYSEFLNLRQFFLKYAHDKVSSNGDLFLIFLNEKDNQTLIVEPLEFTMERNSKSPLTYNYKILLKCVGTLDAIFNKEDGDGLHGVFLWLDKIGNVAANTAAAIGQGRAVINLASGTFQKSLVAVAETINGPLRQIQFATEDLADGVMTSMALPRILYLNAKNSVLDTVEAFRHPEAAINKNSISFNNTSVTGGSLPISTSRSLSDSERQALLVNPDTRAGESAQAALNTQIIAAASSQNRISIPRSFVNDTRSKLSSQSDTLADSLNLGDPLYNSIKGRTVTEDPGALKIASDDELSLLGTLKATATSLDALLATNDGFESDAEVAFDDAKKSFEDPDQPDISQFVNIQKPETVREVTILRGDTLERIAARETGNALNWPNIVVLNSLKPPYIDDNGGDRVKKFGDKLLVPAS